MGDTAVTETPEAPVEGAEATRSTSHLFQWSEYVHVGEGADECEERLTGACKDPEHFHGWICLPNSLQHKDILEKARAARARRKRALRDSGSGERPATDAYVMLESELDDMMTQDRAAMLKEMAERTARKALGRYVTEIRDEDERFENYEQDAEEWRRQSAMPEEERDTEEFKLLDQEMTDFGIALEKRSEEEVAREIGAMEQMSEEDIRGLVRKVRVEGEGAEAHVNTYYTWMAFICTRQCAAEVGHGKRYFQGLDDLRNASPEVVSAVDNAMRDLESRMLRGDAAGN